MKGRDIFCKSQSSTSTLGGGTMEGGSTSSSSSAIDRYNPIIHDQTRLVKTLFPETSNPQNQNTVDYIPFKINNKAKKKKQQIIGKEEKRQSNAAIDGGEGITNSIMNWRRSWSCMNPGGFVSPPGSSRFLLSEKTLFNVQQDFDPVVKLVPTEEDSKSHSIRKDESGASIQSFPAPPVPCQVVVLRVSLHCRGCEKKMRKHISKMEGVSSFNIDFAAKKVTVEGNVTASRVLESISKVKNAQLWTSSIIPDAHHAHTETKKPEPLM